MNKEITSNKELQTLIRSGVNKLADTVLQTLGPNGFTVGILNELTPIYITKDGVTVARNIVLNNPIENYGAELLKQVANRTVEQAGDGTTTSICLAQAFINAGFDLLNNGIKYKDIKKALEILENDVVNNLKEKATILTQKEIINVATVSANNDKEIGELIQKAYNHSHIVKVDESDSLIDELTTINGMNLRSSYFSKAYINNVKKQSIEYNNLKFIIIKGKLNNIKDIKKYLKGTQESPIIIMAEYFSESVNSIIKDNYNKGFLQIGLVKSPGFAQHRKDLVDDIIYYTNATKLSDTVYISDLDKLSANRDTLVITKKNINTNNSRLMSLREAYDNEDEKRGKDLLEDRINNLTGKVSYIKVGGNSEVEMKERKDRIDDAVLAVKCALEEGIVAGGGHTLKSISDDLLYTKTPILELRNCLYAPYEHIGIRKISNKIVDPVKVTRCALQNAMSVAKTILSTKAIVIS